MAKRSGTRKTVETITHGEAKRKNIPSAEHQSVLRPNHAEPRPVKYPRNTEIDPQLVWRGKDDQDWSDLVVYAPPLYIQEKVHPKVLIDDLLRQTKEAQTEPQEYRPTFSPTSTASPTAWIGPSFTNTIRTGPIA